MKTIQILVVEDERIVADDIKMSLQRLGYVVSGMTSSGEEAVKKEELRNRKFNFWSIVHPDDKKLIMEKANKRGKEEQSSYEFRIISKDGEEKLEK